jgi:hypothetical protein
MSNKDWSNEEFDVWCAEKAMGWEHQTSFTPDGLRNDFWCEGLSNPVKDVDDWHPSTDLNDMHEVEMKLWFMEGPHPHEERHKNFAHQYWRALCNVICNPFMDSVLASVRQRKAAIISIMDQIEEALKGAE